MNILSVLRNLGESMIWMYDRDGDVVAKVRDEAAAVDYVARFAGVTRDLVTRGPLGLSLPDTPDERYFGPDGRLHYKGWAPGMLWRLVEVSGD